MKHKKWHTPNLHFIHFSVGGEDEDVAYVGQRWLMPPPTSENLKYTRKKRG